jgi:hypothetical protein
MTGQPQVDPRVDEIARIIDERLNGQLEDYTATAAAVVDHLDERAAAQDDTYQVALTRAALFLGVLTVLSFIAMLGFALASIWAPSHNDQFSDTAGVCVLVSMVTFCCALILGRSTGGTS